MDMGRAFARLDAWPFQAPHQREPRIGAIDGAGSLQRGHIQWRDVHTNARFAKRRQSFLRAPRADHMSIDGAIEKAMNFVHGLR
jgi:hypothetical protein